MPDHCRVEVLVGYHAVFVDIEGVEPDDCLLYFRLCQLAKRARKAAIVLPPGLIVLHDPFGHTAANSAAAFTAVRLPRSTARRPSCFWGWFGWVGVNDGFQLHFLLRFNTSTKFSPPWVQMPTEDLESLRIAMESRNGHKLIARIMLRPSEVRSMTLTQALA